MQSSQMTQENHLAKFNIPLGGCVKTLNQLGTEGNSTS